MRHGREYSDSTVIRFHGSRDADGLSNSTGIISEYTCKTDVILPRLMTWATAEFGSPAVAQWMTIIMWEVSDLSPRRSWRQGWCSGDDIVEAIFEGLQERISRYQSPDVHLGMHPDDGACYGVWPMSLFDDDA